MLVDVNAITDAIKRVGKMNTRVTPDGDKFKIDINEGGAWRTIQEGISKQTAEHLISKAANRVLLEG